MSAASAPSGPAGSGLRPMMPALANKAYFN